MNALIETLKFGIAEARQETAPEVDDLLKTGAHVHLWAIRVPVIDAVSVEPDQIELFFETIPQP